MLAPLLPGPDGRVPPALREGIVPPSEAERASWASLPPGEEELRSIGARPAYPGAGADLYERTGADASLDVNQIRGGEPRTLVPAIAHAAVSLRLAPRQSPARMREVLERTLRDAAPEGTEVELRWHDAEPVLFEPDLPAIELAVEALERACGARPALIRMGGSIPVVAALAKRMPVVVSGFVLPDDAFHAPNESFSLESLRLGHLAGRELLRALAGLARD
jgi:acetylornithine deacetylase/succinyl-diaminopimelate desuccinylase-like protein